MTRSNDKISAIYELRDAVTSKARLEAAVDEHSTPAGRSALLDATLDVEAKTQQAIETCHECGDVHTAEHVPHAGTGTGIGSGNVIVVDFAKRGVAGVV